MLINFDKVIKEYRISPIGVIHIGAHHGEEYDDYSRQGVKNMLFIEPCKEAFGILSANLSSKPGVTLINCACGSDISMSTMYTETANKGQSNSLLKPLIHTNHYPDIKFTGKEEVEVWPLDDIFFDRSLYNIINMDVQGYEAEVIKGAVSTLEFIDCIYSEINIQELYEGCVLLKELDSLLDGLGFKRVMSKITRQGWGDAVYIRKEKTL